MFYIRVKKIFIEDNRELFGKAEVQFTFLVNETAIDLSDIDGLTDSVKTQEERVNLLKGLALKVKSKLSLPQLEKVGDKDIIRFGENGTEVGRFDNLPESFTLTVYALESDKKTRENAETISQLLDDKTADDLANYVVQLASAGTPVSFISEMLLKLVIPKVVNVFKKDKDDSLGFFQTSLLRSRDFPNGIYDRNRFEPGHNIKVMFSAFSQ
jgi:hypothetical protein